jgi:uncharacterized protein DUF4124
MRLVLAALGLCLAGGAQAQAMYRCTGADGKVSFSDRPCKERGVKQEKREPERRAKGEPQTPAMPSTGSNRSNSNSAEAIEANRLAKQAAEERAEDRKRALDIHGANCRAGDPVACARVEQLKRARTP